MNTIALNALRLSIKHWETNALSDVRNAESRDEEGWKEFAQAELEFLKSLLPK